MKKQTNTTHLHKAHWEQAYLYKGCPQIFQCKSISCKQWKALVDVLILKILTFVAHEADMEEIGDIFCPLNATFAMSGDRPGKETPLLSMTTENRYLLSL